MKLSEQTLQTLKNFASINPNFVAKGGTSISTVAEAKNIIANATVDIDLPEQFAIYDLNEFLGVCGLVDEPHLEIEEHSVKITDSSGRSSVRYYFSDPENLTTSARELIMPEADVTFDLDNATLSRIKRASGALGHDKVRVTASESGTIELTVMDPENSTSNQFAIEVAGTTEINDFEIFLNIANLKVLPGDYKVEISSKYISRFTKQDTGHEYFVAVEKTSSF